MQYTCSHFFNRTFAYYVLSITIRVQFNTHGHVYVMWQNKSEQRMYEHDLGHIFSSHRY